MTRTPTVWSSSRSCGPDRKHGVCLAGEPGWRHGYEQSPVESGEVVGWYTCWRADRPFAVEVAGFAVGLQVILSNPKAIFKLRGSQPGMQGSDFLRQITTVEEWEPKASNCTRSSCEERTRGCWTFRYILQPLSPEGRQRTGEQSESHPHLFCMFSLQLHCKVPYSTLTLQNATESHPHLFCMFSLQLHCKVPYSSTLTLQNAIQESYTLFFPHLALGSVEL
ncbi:Galactosylgalactosylxylosylprotein 3-beta-glucuronosyltransferase 2 [Fukomys damarensis]|uniref:Galactosylgalactosylxylosylprotein 3-beta-glucuronosyltransferase n=1 Tax=Fukomys damarensis TaxID=885580 RepID=A0A091DL39_FUKDA|nr:Galactosylgalactosylxylosylprotein 3-beta-glucuronosyltransferase 2 [Fukomys damarensis]